MKQARAVRDFLPTPLAPINKACPYCDWMIRTILATCMTASLNNIKFEKSEDGNIKSISFFSMIPRTTSRDCTLPHILSPIPFVLSENGQNIKLSSLSTQLSVELYREIWNSGKNNFAWFCMMSFILHAPLRSGDESQ